MGEVVALNVSKQQRNSRAEDLWEAYRTAARKAQTSLDIEDGLAAGVAWRAWLDHFRMVG